MKQLFLLVSSLFYLQCAVAQVDNDLYIQGLKGKVKTVTEIEYSDARMKRPFMKTVDQYDRIGNLTETVHNDYILKLIVQKHIKYETDSNGTVTARNEFNDTGMLIRVVKYKYDTLCRLAEEEDHRFYDGKAIVYKNEYSYDSHGNKLREVNYTDGKPDHNTLYSYDSTGRITGSKLYYGHSDKPAVFDDYYYFTGNEWADCERHDRGVRTHVFRTFDTSGLLLEKTTYVTDYSKQTNEANLKFDKYGNWLIQSVTGTITENYFIARTIEYYK